MEERGLRLVQRTPPGDVQINRALLAMRAEPAQKWTVASLGRVAGLSRAAFARRFLRATGLSPLRWLRGHRVALAKARLVESDAPLALIAADLGYQCEFAFSKAFKRVVGLPPRLFRRAAFAPVTSFRAAA